MRQLKGSSGALLALLAVIFAVKLVVVFQLKDHPLLQPEAGLDTTAYVHLAQRVLAGDLALGPNLYYVSPLYIYVLAAGLAAFTSFTAIRIAQIALGTLSIGLLFLTTRTWFGARAAWMAAVAAAATGLFTFYETLILQSSIDAVLASAALWSLTCGLQAAPGGSASFGSERWIGLAGVIFGIATLNRPNVLVGAAAVIVTALLVRRTRTAAVLALGVGIGLAPIAVRNAAVSGRWALVSSHGGLNFYIGNNERATGFYQEVPGIRPLIEGQKEDARHVASKALGRPVSDDEASDYFYALAWDWMRTHPRRAIALFAKKVFYTLHAQHVALPHSYPFFAYDVRSALRFLVVGPWLIVPLGLLGLCVARRLDPNYLIWLSFVPGYIAGVAAFFVAERYRLPLLVPLCAGTGAAIDFAWRARRATRVVRLAVPGLALAVIAVLVNWRLPLNDGRWDAGLRLAQRYVILGEYARADAWVDRLERTTREPGRAEYGVGLQLIAAGQDTRALPHLRQAFTTGYSAHNLEAVLQLGRLSARIESPAAAQPFFRQAVQLGPDRASAHQQAGLNLVLLRRFPEAKRALSAAVRLAPADPDSLAYLAYCEIALGEIDAGRAHVRAALAAAPANPVARQLADALSRR